MKSFTFNSRETYLAYRAGWKAQYKALSQEIRHHRHAYANAQRDNGMGAEHLWAKQSGSRRATEMLEELKAAKVEAQRQYLAAKAAPMEASAA